MKILIAGIGNIFLGDDAFGVEVVGRLRARTWPAGVTIIDFGIRGLDLAYALQDGYDAVILVDSYAHGSTPGSLCVVEPSLDVTRDGEPSALDTHAMDPLKVLDWVHATAGRLPLLRLIGCEPATFGPEEGQLGLSEAVAAAVEPALELIESVVAEIREELCTSLASRRRLSP